jgi:hypothetical protein
MPGIFERVVYFLFGHPGEDEITRALKRAASHAATPQSVAKQQVGVFLMRSDDDDLSLVFTAVDADTVNAAADSLDWEIGINFLVVALAEGAMELSGSTNPHDGLSMAYRDHSTGHESIIDDPPFTLAEGKLIMLEFLRGEEYWKHRFEGALRDRIA